MSSREDAPGASLRSVVPSLVFDGLCPFLTYNLLTEHVPCMSEIAALGLGAVFGCASMR